MGGRVGAALVVRAILFGKFNIIFTSLKSLKLVEQFYIFFNIIKACWWC
jgi:hypothetical protein